MCCIGKNFISIAYTNCIDDVYPYSDSYESLENVQIISRATAYDHPNSNTYILIFHELLYYGKHMKHSLINSNHIWFNVLDFFDNPIHDDELYIKIDNELNVPVQFKATKCIFMSRMPTRAELDTWQHFDMKSHNEWNPDSVNIRDLSKIYQLSKNDTMCIFHTKRNTVYTYSMPTSNHVHDMYSYHDPSSEKYILSENFSSSIQ